MKNKVLKNVVLFACVLGLVLFQVNFIYATDYNYTNRSSFISTVNPLLSYNTTTLSSAFFSEDLPQDYEDIYQYVLTQYSSIFDSDNLLFCFAYKGSSSGNYFLEIYTSNNLPVNGGYWSYTSGNSIQMVQLLPSGSSIHYYHGIKYASNSTFSVTLTNSTSNVCSKSILNNEFVCVSPFNINFQTTIGGTDNYILRSDPNSDNPENEGYPYSTYFNPEVPSDPDSVLYSQAPFFYNIVQAGMNDPNYDPTDDWAHFRVTVGLFPYMWEYYQRWYYNVHFGYMEDIKSSLLEMSTMASTLDDISDRLALAFPDDQAELNDSIAETLMDDTNNTGLTAEKVSNAKSDFDDGISTYEIDISGSAYSTPFAAIRGGDWSFWSQTTLDNMGSGYSYTYQQTRNSKASNESDIYDENSRSLFNLLGW